MSQCKYQFNRNGRKEQCVQPSVSDQGLCYYHSKLRAGVSSKAHPRKVNDDLSVPHHLTREDEGRYASILLSWALDVPDRRSRPGKQKSREQNAFKEGHLHDLDIRAWEIFDPAGHRSESCEARHRPLADLVGAHRLQGGTTTVGTPIEGDGRKSQIAWAKAGQVWSLKKQHAIAKDVASNEAIGTWGIEIPNPKVFEEMFKQRHRRVMSLRHRGGYTNEEIAELLKLSVETVEKYVGEIFDLIRSIPDIRVRGAFERMMECIRQNGKARSQREGCGYGKIFSSWDGGVLDEAIAS